MFLNLSLTNLEFSKVLKTFDDVKSSIVEDMKNAQRIQILTRTGQRMYENVLQGIHDIDKKEVQLLCLSPKDGQDFAFKMYLQQKHDSVGGLVEESSRHTKFLNRAANKRFKIKVLNYLTPYTLILIDCPIKNENCTFCNKAVIYIELSSFNSTTFGKPVFKVTWSQKHWFEFFLIEYNDIWKKWGFPGRIISNSDALQ